MTQSRRKEWNDTVGWEMERLGLAGCGLEYFSALFWTQPYTWDTDEAQHPEEEDEEW